MDVRVVVFMLDWTCLCYSGGVFVGLVVFVLEWWSICWIGGVGVTVVELYFIQW